MNTLHDPNTGKPEESPSTAVVTPILGGRFARLDYTWAYQGQPQEGSLLIGFDPKSGAISGHWIDSWHNGRKVMACAGKADPQADADAAAPIVVIGSYPVPPGPDWSWRIEIVAAEGSLRIRHVNVIPDGTPYPAGDYPAVEAAYEPA